jgi:hypothetical protein
MRYHRTCDPCGRAVPPGCLTHGTSSYAGDWSACCLCLSRQPQDRCAGCRAHLRRLALWKVLEAQRLTYEANPRLVEPVALTHTRQRQAWRRAGGLPGSGAYHRALFLYRLDVAARQARGQL